MILSLFYAFLSLKTRSNAIFTEKLSKFRIFVIFGGKFVLTFSFPRPPGSPFLSRRRRHSPFLLCSPKNKVY